MSSTTTQARLAEAEAALHRLITGQMVRVVVDQNGERVEFTMTNIERLRAYIAELKALLAGVDPMVRRPMGFIF